MTTDPPVSVALNKGRLKHVAFGDGRRIAGTVYGTVIVMSTIVAGSADHAGWDLATLVASTGTSSSEISTSSGFCRVR